MNLCVYRNAKCQRSEHSKQMIDGMQLFQTDHQKHVTFILIVQQSNTRLEVKLSLKGQDQDQTIEYQAQ